MNLNIVSLYNWFEVFDLETTLIFDLQLNLTLTNTSVFDREMTLTLMKKFATWCHCIISISTSFGLDKYFTTFCWV